MDINIKKIVGAWITSFNPSPDEKKLAEDRYSVCHSCEFRDKNALGVEVCTACGCPLSKKIFTLTDQDSCPKGKWKELDNNFRKTKKHKYKLF